MTIEELQELLSGDADKLLEAIKKEKEDSKVEDFIKQYDVSEHSIIADTETRKDKQINTDKGTVTVKLNRLGLDFQVLIAFRHAAILCANKIQLNATANQQQEKDLITVTAKTWDDNKLDYKTMELAEKMFSETEVAEIWYLEKVDANSQVGYWANTPNAGRPWRLRCGLLAKSLGDDLYPVFDGLKNLIAFGRGYKVKVKGQDEEHFDIYTDEKTYKGVMVQGKLQITPEANPIKKIPIIYFKQQKPDWANVQTLIDRLELLLSNWADINDYNGSPILVSKGKIKGMSAKGESGKVVEIDGNGELKYLSWDHAPESVKNEIETLLRLIFMLSNTPDISFENMKGLGATSGFAYKMMFMDAHLHAAKKEGLFGEGIQRRINYIKAAMTWLNVKLQKASSLSIKPKFEYFLPKNMQEEVDIIVSAVQGGVMSKETGVKQNPLVADADTELKLIEKEKSAEQQVQNDLNNDL